MYAGKKVSRFCYFARIYPMSILMELGGQCQACIAHNPHNTSLTSKKCLFTMQIGGINPLYKNSKLLGGKT